MPERFNKTMNTKHLTRFLSAVLVIVSSSACSPEAQDHDEFEEVEPLDEESPEDTAVPAPPGLELDSSFIDGEPYEPHAACTGTNGGWSYCNSLCPCDVDEGDCDNDFECLPGLECIHDVGLDYGWNSSVDVCRDMEGGLQVTNGMRLWLSADVGVYTSGTGVYRWDDQSPYDNDAYTNDSARYPSRISGALNGRPVLRFYGDDILTLEHELQLDDMSIFVVAKNNKNSGFHMILGAGGNQPNNQFRFQSSTGVLFAGYGNGMPVITTNVGNNMVYHSLNVNYDGSTWEVRRDGQLKSSTAFSSNGDWGLRHVGAWYSQYPLVGDIAEIIVYDRDLSAQERVSVQNYLDAKYNL